MELTEFVVILVSENYPLLFGSRVELQIKVGLRTVTNGYNIGIARWWKGGS